ncbi:hypothetical protein [Acidovorax sp. SUPP3334]|uniref:hypothetical protein n=1 Tax=Acidovorax sp. SUPP3334 TaxID=2920881 RepID=UPI0023DE5696|nr:hypothetical protein [Acidovorax sp. SUPP3334]GKT26099.1 hypothetical protein AVHM3334_20060 [Acidovorax sp. SUPP3334]
MLLKKIGITLIVLACVVVLASFAGRKMIESSPVYQAAIAEIDNKFGNSSSKLMIPMFRTFKFSEGTYSGRANFILCRSQGACYQINAEKNNGQWALTAHDES